MKKFILAISVTLLVLVYGMMAGDGVFSLAEILIVSFVWPLNYFLLSRKASANDDAAVDDVMAENMQLIYRESDNHYTGLAMEIDDVISNIERLKDIILDAVQLLSSSFTTLAAQSNDQEKLVYDLITKLNQKPGNVGEEKDD
ncbi:MAG: hypothetical protein OQK72_02615, partial [Gammaproteobacteria bacterium]|nr:hypothetical protein [Gammaproteobacteria bacterium]